MATLNPLPAQSKQGTNIDVAKALSNPRVESIVSLLGLDPNKFDMSHSYSLSFASAGGNTYNQGLYLNTMTYKLLPPLTVRMQFGLLHQPFGSNLGGNTNQAQAFISSAGVEFNPTENLKMQFEYSRRPGSYYYNPAFRDPISRNRAWFDHEIDDKKDQQ